MDANFNLQKLLPSHRSIGPTRTLQLEMKLPSPRAKKWRPTIVKGRFQCEDSAAALQSEDLAE